MEHVYDRRGSRSLPGLRATVLVQHIWAQSSVPGLRKEAPVRTNKEPVAEHRWSSTVWAVLLFGWIAWVTYGLFHEAPLPFVVTAVVLFGNEAIAKARAAWADWKCHRESQAPRDPMVIPFEVDQDGIRAWFEDQQPVEPLVIRSVESNAYRAEMIQHALNVCRDSGRVHLHSEAAPIIKDALDRIDDPQSQAIVIGWLIHEFVNGEGDSAQQQEAREIN